MSVSCPDLYKALDQSVKRVKELEYQVESMKKALHDIEEEKTEKEEETKKERIDAINKVQVFCSLLQKQLTESYCHVNYITWVWFSSSISNGGVQKVGYNQVSTNCMERSFTFSLDNCNLETSKKIATEESQNK